MTPACNLHPGLRPPRCAHHSTRRAAPASARAQAWRFLPPWTPKSRTHDRQPSCFSSCSRSGAAAASPRPRLCTPRCCHSPPSTSARSITSSPCSIRTPRRASPKPARMRWSRAAAYGAATRGRATRCASSESALPVGHGRSPCCCCCCSPRRSRASCSAGRSTTPAPPSSSAASCCSSRGSSPPRGGSASPCCCSASWTHLAAPPTIGP